MRRYVIRQGMAALQRATVAAMAEPIVPADLLRIVGVADPVTSAGGRVIFRRWTFDRASDRIVSAIWRVERGGAPHPLTAGWNDKLPRVARSGDRLAFVRSLDAESVRVHLLPLDGGEAQPCGPALPAIAALAWSPDGTRLALAATAPHDPATALHYLDAPSGARHIRALPFKSDLDGLLDGCRKHLAVLDTTTGALRWLTSGDFEVTAPDWSPDGRTIAFAARIGQPETVTALADIHAVDVASGERRQLTASAGTAAQPVYSHDGTEIAYLGHLHGDDGGGRFDTELLVIPTGGGAVRSLSAAHGRTVGDAVGSDLRGGTNSSPAWSRDDAEIAVQIAADGSTELRAFARDGSGSRVVAGGERQIFAMAPGDDGGFAIAYTSPSVPNELAYVDAAGVETPLTQLNAAWLAGKHVAPVTRFRPAAADGTQLDAWLVQPRTSEARPPLVLEVHGGPHGAYGHAFHLEFQVLASAGIAVAFGNPRGSQTYGAPYADAIVGDWGGLDAADVLAILDGALAAGTFDEARIGIAGGSYGGFMTTWLLGHSQRFAAGVSMRAVNDFVSELHASDIGWFLERELAVTYAQDGGRAMFERSPMRAATNITAPLLVEHSERDYRCPIDQGEQLFTLLRRLGRTNVEFVRTTGDGHELSRSGKPRSRVLRLRAIAHWFVRHLRPATTSAAPDRAGALFEPLPAEPAYDDAPLAEATA